MIPFYFSHKIFQGTATPRVASAKDPELDRVEEEEGGKDADSGKLFHRYYRYHRHHQHHYQVEEEKGGKDADSGEIVCLQLAEKHSQE